MADQTDHVPRNEPPCLSLPSLCPLTSTIPFALSIFSDLSIGSHSQLRTVLWQAGTRLEGLFFFY